jgi:hypothetical protein
LCSFSKGHEGGRERESCAHPPTHFSYEGIGLVDWFACVLEKLHPIVMKKETQKE